MRDVLHDAGPFHEGELTLQRVTGEHAAGTSNGRIIGDHIIPQAVGFIARQELAVVATVDGDGRPWSSALVGPPGSFTVPRSDAAGARPHRCPRRRPVVEQPRRRPRGPACCSSRWRPGGGTGSTGGSPTPTATRSWSRSAKRCPTARSTSPAAISSWTRPTTATTATTARRRRSEPAPTSATPNGASSPGPTPVSSPPPTPPASSTPPTGAAGPASSSGTTTGCGSPTIPATACSPRSATSPGTRRPACCLSTGPARRPSS